MEGEKVRFEKKKSIVCAVMTSIIQLDVIVKRFSKERGKEYSYVVRKANEWFIPLIRHYATLPISFAAQRELC